MASRALVLAALVAAALAAESAGAATRYCRLVKEKPGDRDAHAETRGLTPFGPYDLKSMDVATNATSMTAVIRVADLTNTSPTAGQEGGTYHFAFTAGPEHSYVFKAMIGGGREEFSIWRGNRWVAPEDEQPPSGLRFVPGETFLADARGVVDLKADEIRMTVPLAVFGGRVKRGTRLTHMGGNSASWKVPLEEREPVTGAFVFGQHEDAVSARARDAYPAGAPSCVRVGR